MTASPPDPEFAPLRIAPFALAAAATLSAVVAAPPRGSSDARAAPGGTPAALMKAVTDPGRPAADRARDKYRHPAQTLAFFGIRPKMTVVELLPGGGWYSAILAPYLAPQGKYIAALPPTALDKFKARMAADPARYGKAEAVAWTPGSSDDFVPTGSADMVLTFRNIHNLLGSEDGENKAPAAFAAWFRALKPGGTLGIVEHRLPETMDSALERSSGYVKRSTVLKLAMAAGFRLAAASEINANPKDTHDWPKGVWTLPPTYTLGDQDRAKYAAIGESDRMTLRFVKPDGDAATPPPPPAG